MENPSAFLLANCKPSARLTAYDGKVGTVIGNYVYTTPNESFIPHPILGHRHVRVREDYRFGPDDHTLWPQPYSAQYPHLGAIPRRPSDPTNPLSAMWYDPVDSDFVPLNNGSIVDGLGRLSPSILVTRITPLVVALQNRHKAWSSSLVDAAPVKKFAGVLERALHYTYTRLQALVTSWHQIRFTFTELQRYYLELLGCLDYMQIYKPRMDSRTDSEPPLADAIGVYTSNVRIIEEFMAAGIPVWYIREVSPSGFGNNVLSYVKPEHYYNCLMMQPHNMFEPLFSGEVYINSTEVVNLVHKFSRKWSCGTDPFEDVPSVSGATGSQPSSSHSTSSTSQHPTSSTSAMSAPRASSSQSGPPPKKRFRPAVGSRSGKSAQVKPKHPPKPQRDKFLPLTGPLAPLSIPAWALALQNVDRKQPPTMALSDRSRAYAYPDPGLFVAVETDQRRQHLIESYGRIQDAWITRLHTTSGVALIPQEWRDLLTIDYNQPVPDYKEKPGDTAAMQSHRKALRLLIPPGARARKTFISTPTYMICDEKFPSGTIPPNAHIRKFLFELYELNFRKELRALHCLAHPKFETDTDMQERQFEVQSLFPDLTYYIPCVDPPNSGLAADDIKSRLPFLLQLAGLMLSWKGEKPAILGIGQQRDIQGISLREAHELEQAVASHYCQQFFNYFRRAAQIPHRLFPVGTTSPSLSTAAGSASGTSSGSASGTASGSALGTVSGTALGT